MQSPKSPRGSNLQVSDEKLAAIKKRLEPASPEFIGEELQKILAHFPNVRDAGPEGTAARAAGYVVALMGFGEATIKALHMAILRGSSGFDPRFLPLAPEMAAYCRQHEKLDRQMLDWNTRGKDQILSRVLAPKSPAVLKGFDALKAELQKKSAETNLRRAAGGDPGKPQEEI